MSICKVIKGICKVKTTVQCISPTEDLLLEADPGQLLTVPVVIRTNSNTAVPLTFELALNPVNPDITLVTTAGIANAKADTTINVQIQVGANSAGGDFNFDLTISY